MTAFSQAVSNTYDRGVKTFVAEAVGGSAHGRLFRMPEGVERLLVPVAGEFGVVYEPYHLHRQPDGVLILLHADKEAP